MAKQNTFISVQNDLYFIQVAGNIIFMQLYYKSVACFGILYANCFKLYRNVLCGAR